METFCSSPDPNPDPASIPLLRRTDSPAVRSASPRYRSRTQCALSSTKQSSIVPHRIPLSSPSSCSQEEGDSTGTYQVGTMEHDFLVAELECRAHVHRIESDYYRHSAVIPIQIPVSTWIQLVHSSASPPPIRAFWISTGTAPPRRFGRRSSF